MSITQNINKIKEELPQKVKLVAVSKFKPEAAILEAYNGGQRVFGENRVQELVAKYQSLPKDIEWHLIGHLQSNKVKYIVPFVHLIHSVDSFKLLEAIDKEAIKFKRVVDCLLEVHIAEEDAKFGFSENEIIEMLESVEFKELRNIRICGVMGMATFTDNERQIRKEFLHLSAIFNSIKNKYFNQSSAFCEISIGMSGDYKLAIECGSTIVRIGTTIFGERD
jgi:PLP dependent protein